MTRLRKPNRGEECSGVELRPRRSVLGKRVGGDLGSVVVGRDLDGDRGSIRLCFVYRQYVGMGL